MAAAVTPTPSREGRLNPLRMPLSERETAMLRAYAETGYLPDAAEKAGVSVSVGKNLLSHAYERLDVYGAINAFRALGWLTVQS